MFSKFKTEFPFSTHFRNSVTIYFQSSASVTYESTGFKLNYSSEEGRKLQQFFFERIQH